MKTIEERFFIKINKTLYCWLWVGAVNSSGYGHMIVKGKVIDAHRISYKIHYGEIPYGINVLHICDNKTCVNPTHLRLGTDSENMKEWWERHPHKPSPGLSFKGRKHTLDARSKISLAAIGNKYCVGRKLTEKQIRDVNGRFVKFIESEQ